MRDQTSDMKRDVSKQLFSPPAPNIQDDRPRLINVPSQASSQYLQEPAVFNQFVGSSNIPNLALSTQYSTIQPEPQSYNAVPGKSVENYPNLVPPMPAVWQFSQPSQPPSDIYNYPPVIAQISPPLSSSAIINTQPNNIEFSSKVNEGVITQEPIKFQNGNEDGTTQSFQINIPYQNVPVPTITVITANSDAGLTYPHYQPTQQPIIVKKSKSSMKSILPILLIALLSDQGCCGNCCCPCNCNSPIFIPYPIPIPINNSITSNNSSSSSSRNRGDTENEDDSDEE